MEQRVAQTRPWHAWGGIAVLLLAHTALNAVWLRKDRTLRAEDMGTQLVAQAQARAWVVAEGARGVVKVLRGREANPWPSAGTLPAVAIGLVVGQSPASLRLANVAYLALLLVGVYLIGRRCGSPRAGLLAAALVSFCPGVYGPARQFGVDLPATAVLVLCVALLLASERLTRLATALAFGLLGGVALLLRPHLAPILAAVALVEVVRGLRSRPRWRVAVGASLAALAAALVTSVWWAGRLEQVISSLARHQQGEEMERWSQGASWLYYLEQLPVVASTLLLVSAVGGGVALGLSARSRSPNAETQRPRELALLAAWLLSGLGVLALLRVHKVHYLFPLCPVIGLIAAIGLLAIPHRFGRRVAVATSLVGGALSLLLCSIPGPGEIPQLTERRRSFAAQCGPWEYCGPPALDAIYLTSERAVALLRARHGAGHGVVVRMPLDFELLHGHVVARALLALGLPAAQITGLDWRDHAQRPLSEEQMDMHVVLGNGSIPLRVVDAEHCYSLLLGHTEPAPPDDQAVKLLGEAFDTQVGPMGLSLWHHPRCPFRPPRGASS
jgi:hypothetical protein